MGGLVIEIVRFAVFCTITHTQQVMQTYIHMHTYIRVYAQHNYLDMYLEDKQK